MLQKFAEATFALDLVELQRKCLGIVRGWLASWLWQQHVANSLMWTAVVVIVAVLANDVVEMILSEDDEVVQCFLL